MTTPTWGLDKLGFIIFSSSAVAFYALGGDIAAIMGVLERDPLHGLVSFFQPSREVSGQAP